MKTIISILTAMILVASLNAQKIVNQTISSCGLNTAKLTMVVGQTVCTTINSTSNVMIQGFLQPYSQSSIALPINSEVSISVYPNPVIDVLNIISDKSVNYSIYNINGILITTGNTQNTPSVDLSNQLSGTYIILIEKVSFKIVKQ